MPVGEQRTASGPAALITSPAPGRASAAVRPSSCTFVVTSRTPVLQPCQVFEQPLDDAQPSRSGQRRSACRTSADWLQLSRKARSASAHRRDPETAADHAPPRPAPIPSGRRPARNTLARSTTAQNVFPRSRLRPTPSLIDAARPAPPSPSETRVAGYHPRERQGYRAVGVPPDRTSCLHGPTNPPPWDRPPRWLYCKARTHSQLK